MSSKKPSTPEMKAFVVMGQGGERNGNVHPSPIPTRRPPEVNEAILERATAKLEALSEHFDKMVGDVATKAEVQRVYLEARRTRRLLEAHIAGVKEDRAALNGRLDAIMSLLGEVIARK